MSIYYRLLNDTKRESVHLDYHVKRGPMQCNPAVHFALCNYMMANIGDNLRICGDNMEAGEDYKDVDLLAYDFYNPEVIVKIVNLLNSVYECDKYAVIDGCGREVEGKL